MKRAILGITLTALTASAVNAEILKNFKAGGSLEAAGMVVNNSNDFNRRAADKFGDVQNRVMINAGFDLNEDVAANLSFNKCNRKFAQASEAPVATAADSFLIDQAYVTLRNLFTLDHRIGRQYYGSDGDIVIYYGPANWYTRGLNANNVALDGWTSQWAKDKLAVSGVVAKVAETNTITNTDTDVYGVTGSYDYSKIIKPAAYVYQKKTMTALGSPKDLIVLGLKGKGEYMGVRYGGEFAKNLGRDHVAAQKYTGYAFKLNAAYDYSFMGRWTFSGEFARGSGDKGSAGKNEGFMDISANYRPGLIIGGVGMRDTVNAVNNSANTSLNNLTTWNLGADWAPEKVKKLGLAARFYSFTFTRKFGGAKHAGNEADLVATWTHTRNVALKLGLAKFIPDTYKIGGKDDSVNLGSLYMNIGF
ncbi:MAG: alginate export family protein [Elusimicrobia bacterium]|nr:alginate export family protein [Elusimicrobiota bacterium]